MSERITIDKVKPGMVIIKVTAQNGPVKIKKSGLVSSQDMVNALSEMGVQEVEIDPSISAEIPKKSIPKSQTQALLDASANSVAVTDNRISEQFNRNLFLPSIQELPEAWQYYSTKLAVAILIIIGGLSLGFSGARVQQWLTVSNSAATSVPAVIEENIDPQQQSDSVDSAPPQVAATESALTQQEVTESAAIDVEQQIDTADQTLQEEQLSEPVTAVKEQQSVASISPELLKRFEKAVAAIDDGGAKVSQPYVPPQNDVPAVQDLPAWILTQLPSMSFSAHLYASEPSERWVRVNGRQITEGQEVEDGVRLIGIEPQHVILAYKGQEFSMEALSEW